MTAQLNVVTSVFELSPPDQNLEMVPQMELMTVQWLGRRVATLMAPVMVLRTALLNGQMRVL